MRDLCQKVRHTMAHSQAFDRHSDRTPFQTHISFSRERFGPKLAELGQQKVIEHNPHTFLLLTC